jgi:hypothetical protein
MLEMNDRHSVAATPNGKNNEIYTFQVSNFVRFNCLHNTGHDFFYCQTYCVWRHFEENVDFCFCILLHFPIVGLVGFFSCCRIGNSRLEFKSYYVNIITALVTGLILTGDVERRQGHTLVNITDLSGQSHLETEVLDSPSNENACGENFQQFASEIKGQRHSTY